MALFLAESVRFELTVRCRITSFQDWLLKPLGQLSMWGKSYHFTEELSRNKQPYPFLQDHRVSRSIPTCSATSNPFKRLSFTSHSSRVWAPPPS